jgi:hypothetical protein
MSMGICGLRCIGVRRIRLLLELGLEEAGRWAGRLYGACNICRKCVNDIQTLSDRMMCRSIKKLPLTTICYNGRNKCCRCSFCIQNFDHQLYASPQTLTVIMKHLELGLTSQTVANQMSKPYATAV